MFDGETPKVRLLQLIVDFSIIKSFEEPIFYFYLLKNEAAL